MKRIKQEIKKNSQDLIESSLPEISSLDNIQIKPKKTKNFPILLAPIGAACAAIAVVAILVPTIMRSGATVSHSSHYNNYSNPNLRFFDLNGYQPKCESFDEVAYYSYLAYNQKSNNDNSTNKKDYVLRSKDIKAESPGTYVELRERFTDNYGREHRPIPLDLPIKFSDFLYFEFDTDENNIFLDERIGNGHITGLVIENSYLEEDMIILKNGENYYSCLRSGGSPYRNGERATFRFCANSMIEGFDYVKDITNTRYITLYFSGTTEGIRELDTLCAIDVDGTEYPINPETFFYDESAIVCTIGEIREYFGLEALFDITNNYGGADRLVYDASVPETANFSLEEFDDAFRVSGNEVFLGEHKIFDINNTSKIYASEINKDSHRDLVYETIEEGKRTFAIYDAYNKRFLYKQDASKIQYDYEFYLNMRDNRLVIDWFEPGMTAENYMLDYGVFAYQGKKASIGIHWKDILQCGWVEMKGIYEADGVTPVQMATQWHYGFHVNTPYIIELFLRASENNPYLFLTPEHPIRCRPYGGLEGMTNSDIGWHLISSEGPVSRYQFSFPESGVSAYELYFYNSFVELGAAVDWEE